MPQVMIGLSARDYKTTNEVWRLAKRHLNPIVRRRIGWRGRSSFLRQLILYGFERASENPAAFLHEVRETHDPLIGKRGRSEAGAERREALIGAWGAFFPSDVTPSRRTRRAAPARSGN
jgi:hypothetical protein